MVSKSVADFVVLDSVYGRFIVNRHCAHQAEALLKTGQTHIEQELGNIRAILSSLSEGCVMVDGGANIGFVAVPCALAIRDKGGSVHAYEPQRMMFNALCGTVALNSLDNLFVFQKALGETNGSVFMPKIDYSAPADFGMVQVSETEGEPVSAVTLDSQKLKRLDFFKLDVEGYEVRALKGGRKTIEKFEPWCWVEHWMAGQQNIISCFSGLEYKFYLMDKLNLLCAPVSRLKSFSLNVKAVEIFADSPIGK